VGTFTETAVLQVSDQSSGQLKAIESALRKLNAESAKAKSAFSAIKPPKIDPGLAKTLTTIATAMTKLKEAQKGMRSQNINISVKVQGTAKLEALNAALTKYNTLSKKAIPLNLTNRVQSVPAAVQRVNAGLPAGGASGGGSGTGGGGATAAVGGGGSGRSTTSRPNAVARGLGHVGRGVAYTAGYGLAFRAYESFVEGMYGVDVSKTQARLLNMKEREDLENFVLEQAKLFPELTEANIRQMTFENAALLGDPLQAKQIMPAIFEQVRLAMLRNLTREQAVEEGFTLSRMANVLSAFSDQLGNLDVQALRATFDTAQRAQIVSGRDLDEKAMLQTAKNLRASGQALTPAALLKTFLLTADMGGTAGVGINQLIKNLSGRAFKAQMQEQARLGLAVQNPETGRFTSINPQLLRNDPFEFIAKYITGPGGAFDQLGIDATKMSADEFNAAVSEFSDTILSHRTAADLMTKAILQQQELINQARTAENLDLSPENVQRLAEDSTWFQMQAAGARITNSLGLIADGLEDIIIPTLEGIGSGIQWFTNQLKNDQGEIGLGASLAASLGIGAMVTAIFNPSAIALTASAFALNRSATALTAAARAQAGGAALDGAGGPKKTGFFGKLMKLGAVAGITAASIEGMRYSVEELSKTNADEGRRLATPRDAERHSMELLRRDPAGVEAAIADGARRGTAEGQVEATSAPGIMNSPFMEDVRGILSGIKDAIEKQRIEGQPEPYQAVRDRTPGTARPGGFMNSPFMDDVRSFFGLEVAPAVEAIDNSTQQIFQGAGLVDQGAAAVTTSAGQATQAAGQVTQAAGQATAAGGTILSALNEGAANVAGQIRAALAAGVSVNVNTPAPARSVPTGNMGVAP